MKDCFVFVLIVFGTVTTTDIVPKRQWAKVLEDLIDVNRHRVDTMLKLYQMQEKNFGKHSYLRTVGKKKYDYPKDDEEDNRKSLLIYLSGKNNLREDPLDISKKEEFEASMEVSPLVEIVNIPKNKVPLEVSVDKKQFDDTIDKLDLTVGLNLTRTQEKMLRKAWHSACDKQAAKVCIRACKDAFKTVCRIFTCKGKMMSKMKKECKRMCKTHFGAGDRDSDGDSGCDD